MDHLKLFEAYSTEDYKKALKTIKSMVQSNRPKDDVVAFINTYYSDNMKEIDKLRIILGRIEREMLYKKRYLMYNRRPGKTHKKPDFKVSREYYDDYDQKEYFAFDKVQQGELLIWVDREKAKYEKIRSFIETDRFEFIESIFERIFDLLYWAIEHAPEKSKIISSHDEYGPNRTDVHHIISKVESFNDLDFENEVEELKNLIRIGKTQIKNAANEI